MMKRVLVVDDKEENLYYLEALLSGHGFEVERARHGAEALVLARKSPPELVVSDLLMPVMDGYTLLRHWKGDEQLRGVPFLVYTATYTEEEDERLALSLGADAFILKPTEPMVFIERIGYVMENFDKGGARSRQVPVEDERELLKVYSETLIRKLEEKTLMLAETNRLLEEDIVRRREVEMSLRASEANQRQLLRALEMERARLVAAQRVAKIGSWETDLATRAVSWSEETHRIFGTDPATFARTHEGFLARIHPEDRAAAAEVFERSFATGETLQCEHRILMNDGRVKFVSERWQIFPDDSGKAARAIGTCRDVTERALAEGRIRSTAALLRAVADGTSDAVFVKDIEGRYLFINAAAANFMGRPADQIIGQDDSVFFDGESARIIRENDRRAIEAGHPITEEEHLNPGGETRIFLATKAPYRSADGSVVGVIGISRDITEKKSLEAQFLRAQRMESIGTLAGGIAHDLNNVLTPIMMSIDLLRTEESDPLRCEILEAIEVSARRGADMVKQVLSFARGVDGRRLEVEIGKVVAEIRKIADETFLKSISVITDVSGDPGLIVGDPTQIHQVLLNLCVNARDAMPDGGVLSIRVSNLDVDEQYAATNIDAEPGRYVVVEVADTGFGMRPEVIERIFEPFFTTKELGRGTGLGLSTTLAIVKSHGGFVLVNSKPGAGTVFRVFFPAARGTADVAALVNVRPLSEGKGETILVVDDEIAVREITRQTLELHGYQVILASDGAEATALYAMRKDEIDAVFTDMMMPTMDGAAALLAIRRINPDALLIAASGVHTEAMVEKAVAAGVSHFLPKPYTAETLLQTLRNALDGRVSVS